MTVRTPRSWIDGLIVAVALAGLGCESVVRPEPRMPRLNRNAASGPVLPAPQADSARSERADTVPDAADLRELETVPRVPAERIVPELAPADGDETARP